MTNGSARVASASGRERQDELFAEAEQLFPGGVNSPVRAFRAVGARPLLLERGYGSHVWDADGRAYIDYIGGWGPAILGHADPQVLEAVHTATDSGFALGATNPLEIELATAIRDAMPSIERLRFTSSGTEAAMSAIRLARAATGRPKIVKFAGAYHGHADALLVEAGSGLATQGIPGSAGVTEGAAADTLVLPFNDPAAVALAFETHPGRIAGVIVEAVMANVGVIPPAPGFLEQLLETTRADGALLIFDEVITGFRVAHGGAQARYGVAPDLTVLGKIIGGGMPIGAYGGTRELFDHVAPLGAMYQAGTLSGHPLSMAAGLATLGQLAGDGGADRYAVLESRAAALEAGLRDATGASPVPVSISRVGSLLTVFFLPQPPADAAEALLADREAFGRFFRGMLAAGVLLPPSQFEAWFLSMAHTDADLEATVDAARLAFAAVR